jgi:L-glutamine:2-deoxy-scyllo-inosose/3-amino-2,3-dideoxy-scyllo-inosose aminotransferase
MLSSVLASHRWAITSPNGSGLFERRFARKFADYVGAAHCVPVDHGSSALVVALESLGLDYGELVLVPALTWTASATAVLRAGLVPVLIDVDPWTGCITPETLDLGVGARAVIAVHWACAMADVPAIASVAAARDITVIEDAAQSHGARWQGRQAGSIGRLGCFSMQNSKVLTSGEGGAIVTNDDDLVPVLEELRADSRSYRHGRTPEGELELTESASVMGANFCLSEFQAALLCAQLESLDAQHDARNANYAKLAELLEDIPGVRLLRHRPEQDRISIYETAVIFDPLPAGMTNTQVADALTAELGTRVYTPREPLIRSRLLQPWTKPALRPLAERFAAIHRNRKYPNADYLTSHAVLTHHSTFLGNEQDMEDLATAIAKVAAHTRPTRPTLQPAVKENR